MLNYENEKRDKIIEKFPAQYRLAPNALEMVEGRQRSNVNDGELDPELGGCMAVI